MKDKSLDQRNNELNQKLEHNPIDQSVEVLVKDAKRRGRQILLLTISLAIDIVLTAALAWLTFATREIATDVQNSKDTIVNNCKVGNEFRKIEAELWDHILSFQQVQTGLTPEEQARRDANIEHFRGYFETIFAPRDCNNIIEN